MSGTIAEDAKERRLSGFYRPLSNHSGTDAKDTCRTFVDWQMLVAGHKKSIAPFGRKQGAAPPAPPKGSNHPNNQIINVAALFQPPPAQSGRRQTATPQQVAAPGRRHRRNVRPRHRTY